MEPTGVEQLVGRERELAEIEEFLVRSLDGPELLLLEGQPGIGKTSLWQAGVDEARQRGFRVLSARPAEAEAKLSFSALGDLLLEATGEIGALPAPQRRALRIALLLEEPTRQGPGTRAIAVATLSLIDSLASSQPVLVAVDDVQWLDGPTASALTFALRRLGSGPVGFLGTSRPGGALSVERIRRTEVGPLDDHAIHRIVSDALSSLPARRLLRRLERIAGGNPFYALEIARAFERQSAPLDPSGPLPIPQDLRSLVRQRLKTLPAHSREALTVAAALAHPTIGTVDAAVGAAANALESAEEAAVVEIVGDTVRFTHPLLASVIYSDADAAKRRRVHARLGDVVSDPEERARHLAASVERPDEEVAAALEHAAAAAFDRGAIESAAELIEQALRLTPDPSGVRARARTLTAAGYLARAGAKRHARELVSAAFSAAPNGRERARTVLTATWLGLWPSSLSIERLRDAIRDAAGDERLLADLHSVLAHKLLYAPDLPAAGEHARTAVAIAERLGDEARLAVALIEAVWVDFFIGKGLDRSRLERAIALEHRAGSPFGSTGAAEGLLAFALGVSGELEEAARLLEARIADLRRRGDTGVTWSLQELARVEVDRGRWDRARELAEESVAISLEIDEPIQSVLAHRWLTRLAALRGEIDEARARVAEGIPLATAAETPLTRADLLSVLGFLELSIGNTTAALEHLREVARFAAAIDLGEPGALPFAPDWVEALVAVGDLDTAEAAATGLDERSRRLNRTSMQARASRCRALVAAGRGELATAIELLEDAAERAPADQPFELGRTLLVQGRVLRRARRNGPARLVLERAASIFANLGAPIWERNARAELARIGGRAAHTTRLTVTEQQIAELVASGRTNHEVARTLHVSPKTVEWNLSKVYKKLRVSSRTELAAKLANGPTKRSGEPEPYG